VALAQALTRPHPSGRGAGKQARDYKDSVPKVAVAKLAPVSYEIVRICVLWQVEYLD